MIFEVPGKPCAKGRPRFANGHAYTPKKTAAYENLVALAYIQAGGQITDAPIELHITAYFPIPKSARKRDKEKMEQGYIRHTKRPDVDNLLKSVQDGLNEVAYYDDSQIYRVTAEKRYGPEPKVIVSITEVG